MPLKPSNRDELMALPAQAQQIRARNDGVAPQALELTLGHPLGNVLRASARSRDARDALRALHREDLEAVALAWLFEWRQLADDSRTYSEWSAL